MYNYDSFVGGWMKRYDGLSLTQLAARNNKKFKDSGNIDSALAARHSDRNPVVRCKTKPSSMERAKSIMRSGVKHTEYGGD